jgi:hypothetical protein
MDTVGVKNRHRRAMEAHWLKIQRRIDLIFVTFPNAQDDPHEFIRLYERVFAPHRFPFWYARARTEFGTAFGRDLSSEDAAWGTYRPVDEEQAPISEDEQIARMENEMAEYDSSEAITPADQTEIDDLDDGPW